MYFLLTAGIFLNIRPTAPPGLDALPPVRLLHAQMEAPPRPGSRSLVVRDRKPICAKPMLIFQSFEEQSGQSATQVIAGVSTAFP
jgi:hypothetical protein